MTIKSWLAISSSICKYFRAIKNTVKVNPHWWILAVFDGFGAHFFYLKAMVGRYDNNIIFLRRGQLIALQSSA